MAEDIVGPGVLYVKLVEDGDFVVTNTFSFPSSSTRVTDGEEGFEEG